MRVNSIVEWALRVNKPMLVNGVHQSPRDNDRVLQLQVWEQMGFNLTTAQESKFLNVAAPETVRRMRQKYQEQGKYQATDRIRRVRKFKGLQMQQQIPSLKPEHLQKTMEAVPEINKRWPRQRGIFEEEG